MLTILFRYTPLKFFIQSFWRDEAFTYLLASRSIPDILSLTAQDFNPPFYYIVLHFWMSLFGRSEVSLRTLSFICYWGIVYVCYRILHEIMGFTRTKSLWYLILVVLNPVLIYYAFEARMYTMFTLFACVSFYAFYRQKRILYAVATILGLYTHYFMLLVLFSQLVFSLRYLKDKNRIADLRMIVLTGLSLAIWFGFVLTNKPVLSQQFWILRPTISSLVTSPATLYTGYEPDYGFLAYRIGGVSIFLLILAALLIGVSSYAFFHIRHKRLPTYHRFFAYLVIWAFLGPVSVFLLSQVKPLYLMRYLMYATPGLILLFIYALDLIPFRVRMAIILMIGILTVHYHALQVVYRGKSNLSRTIGEIKSLAGPQDVLYVTSDLNFHVAQYYFDPKRVYIYGESYEDVPVYVGKVLIAPDRIATSPPPYPQKAFVLTSDDHYDIKSLN